MGKLRSALEKQLSTEYSKDAEDCLKIYAKLAEINGGHVWSSDFTTLVGTSFVGYPNTERIYVPTAIGRIFLEGIK